MGLPWVVIDFETVSGLDVTKTGAWRYAEDPSTEILCCGWKTETTAGMWMPAQEQKILRGFATDQAIMFLAFNAQFEKAIWRHIMVAQYGFPDVLNNRWHDIQAVAAMKGLPQSLGQLAKILKQETQKADFRVQDLSKFDKKTGRSLLTAEKVKECLTYCYFDVAAETEAHSRLGWLPPDERKVWLLNQTINERGICLDLPLIEACRKVVASASKPLIKRFGELTEGLKPSQGEKFKAWIKGQGVDGLDTLAKERLTEALGGEDEIEGTLFSGGMDFPAPVREALEIRQAIGSASIKKLGRMLECVSSDGRSRGLLQYHGTGPGRSAGRLWQPHNLPKPSSAFAKYKFSVQDIVDALMTGDAEYVEMILGFPAIEVVATALRHILIPAKGHVFMAADYSGIQARLVLAVAGQSDKAALLATGKDVYVDMATAIFRRPIDKERDPKERGTGKNAVLGLGFQMGANTFQEKYGREQPLEFAANVVKVYRKEWAPKVPYLWYGLEEAAVETVHAGTPHEAYGVLYAIEDQWLTVRLPSGRKIWYFHPCATRSQAPWNPDELKNSFSFVSQKNGHSHDTHAFGGLLTENVIMGMERDIMTKAQLQCEANGLPVVLEVHDEIVVEPLAKNADEKAFQQILLDTDPWVKAIQAPIAVEGWVGERYRK